MESMRGLTHKTSMQAAREWQASLGVPLVAGQKRRPPSPTLQDHGHRRFARGSRSIADPAPDPEGLVRFQRAIALPLVPTQLRASRIVDGRADADAPGAGAPVREVSEYTQRRQFAATPSSTMDPELDLAHPIYGLPTQLVENFASLGIRQIYPWQKNCLKGPGLLDGTKNLVYCAPTGGGKSLVADLLILKRVMGEPGTKALLILPYVALVQEKANMLINTAIEDCSVSQLRAVVLDELHMVDDDHRGYLLELIGTKLLALEQPIQIVGMIALAHETVLTGYGVLLFAGSRGMCEADARVISRVMPQHHEVDPDVMDKRMDLLGELRSLSSGVDPVLEETAGLTSEERDLISAAYGKGVLLVPARRVILHNARMGREFVGPAMLRQMRGRAGRQGKAPVGETYLCCRPEDLENVLDLVYADIPEVASCINSENKRVQRAILEVVAIRLATSREALSEYFSTSLLSFTNDDQFVEHCLETGLAELVSLGLLAPEGDYGSSYSATKLGKAIVASSVDPFDGVFIHAELAKSLKAFVMDGEMHILYLFTPVQDFGVVVNWQIFRKEMDRLDESGFRVLRFLGIKPTAISRLAQGASLKESSQEEKDLARMYRRLYLAFQLRDLCNEMPIHSVAKKYDVPRGSVQSLSQTCQGFAAGMIKFCEHMEWGMMAAALEHFSDRLMAGARTDLLLLAKIPFIKSRTARVFWENGYRSVGAIANADPKELVTVLLQAQPNKLRVPRQDEGKVLEKLHIKANVISAAANRLWQAQLQAEMAEE
ncbi:DNA polymerase theta [Escovopsis weberi]|uniref:DNA polymerase theta n=1 Tax=Escovopsis weberi TaxID=150374 RepID=A0A0M9VTI1_ESCWE|nr:DNA polymerase theta [Escovopsis weberi]